MRKSILALLLLSAAMAHAQSDVVTLWPEGVPNAKPALGPEHVDGERISNVSQPTLAVYPACYQRRAQTCAASSSCPEPSC